MDLKLIDTNTSEVDKEEKQQTEEEAWGYTTRQHSGTPKLPMPDENKHI